MAQLLIAGAGAAIGSFFGPVGAQIGWVAGSLAGGLLFAPQQQGPRLADTKVQVSSYGAPIQIAYGGVRLTGNVIWSTDLVEHESSGGKGGPSVTTYSYTVSCAIAICEGPIAGIRRIWADAKLVYDIREDADASTQAVSADFAEHMTLYLGTEVQNPDPTIEAAEGAGTVEAYRGVAYVVFADLPLGDYGNRIPQFSFELSGPAVETEVDELAPLVLGPWENTGNADKPRHSVGTTTYRYPPTGTALYEGPDLAAAEAALIADHPWAGRYISYYTSRNAMLAAFSSDGATDAADSDINDGCGARYVYLAYNYESPDIVYDGVPIGLSDQEWCLPFDCINYDTAVMASSFPIGIGAGGAGGGHTGIGRFYQATAGGYPYPYPYDGSTGSGTFFGANCVGCPPSGGYFPTMRGLRHQYIRAERTLSIPESTCEPGNPLELGIAELPDNPAMCITRFGELTPNIEYAATSGTFKQLQALTQDATEVTKFPLGPVLASTDPNYSSSTYWDAQAAAAGVSGTYDVDYPVTVSDAAIGSYTVSEAAEANADLQDIIEDICSRSGLDGGEVDAAELGGKIVQGYRIPRQMSGRAAIEPLQSAYWFDAVENGEVIEFVLRGGASIATIESDDLGAGEEQAGDAEVRTKRQQETELPAELTVVYECRAADYQAAAQQARRSTTGSQQVRTLELPLVLTDQRAAEAADVLMVDAWQGRTTREFSTTRKHSKLLPTDVIEVQSSDGFTYRGRLVEKTEDGPVIRWVLRDESAATYDPNVTPGTTSGGGSTVRFIAPMRAELMDLPALRDDDDDAGFYAGAAAFAGTFRGGTLYRSLDDADYTAIGTMSVAATMGYTSTALGDFSGGNIVDEANAVTVVLNAGSLETITRTQLLNGGNLALIGDEVLQFERATLTAPLTYRLSGLLRGRRGTEQHMGSHAATDRFVLLSSTTVYRMTQSVSQIGAAYYKGVGNGATLDGSWSMSFTNTGAALKPLSPAHLEAFDIGGGDYRVQWVRRTRIAGTWRDGVDVPLAEASEQYIIEVVRAGVVVSTDTVTVQYATVEAMSGDTVNVYQLSALVGRGFVASIVLE